MQVALAVVVMNRPGPLCLSTLWLVAGCSISPVPEPPVTPPTLDTTVGVAACATCDAPFILQGAPGAVRDGTRIWAVNLDQTTPPVIADVAADGSYKLAMIGESGNEVRLQARRDDVRSTPVDVVLGNDSPLKNASRPFADCFRVITDLDFGLQSPGSKVTRSITLTQSCAAPLTVSRIALRAPSAALTFVAPSTPLVLASGAPLSIDVSYSASSGSTDEEVLLVETSAPSKDRRAIDLAGRAAP